MVRRTVHTIALITACFALALTGVWAATAGKALADTEARRRTAENSAREIKSKPSIDATRALTTYMTAAAKNNAWLDAVSQAIQSGSSLADVKPTADDAAAALLEWVVARNSALAVTAALDGAAGAGVESSVSQDLQLIFTSIWKDNQRADQNKRAKAAADLQGRLRWKSWEEIQ